MTDRARGVPRVTIVGGGFSGTSVAVQLARRAAHPLSITLVEPRPEVGCGLAYSTDDPDHRLNGSAGTHLVDPLDPEEFTRWLARDALARADRDALAPSGTLFARRRDFGRFVRDAFERAARAATGPATLRHLCDEAVAVTAAGPSPTVTTRHGARLASELVVLATGNAPARFPAAVAAGLAHHPGVIAEPFDLPRLRALDRDARVLVLGTGLTALDVVTTLLRAGHAGRISAVSTHGLRPRPHRGLAETPDAAAGREMLRRIDGPLPPFVRGLARPLRASAIAHVLRARIAEAARAGEPWYAPFDEFRDPLWRIWTDLGVAEKRRLLRHARRFYDVHRFRAPPQNEAIVRDAERAGRVAFAAAKVCAIAPGGDGGVRVTLHDRGARTLRDERFDAVVNCSGLDAAGGAARSPLLASLVSEGVLAPDPTGVGFAVDRACRPLGTSGAASDALCIVGPPTAGAFGDPLGAMFIAAQIGRIVPGILASLGRSREAASG